MRTPRAARRSSATSPPTPPLFDLSRPELDFVSFANGTGGPAARTGTAEELARRFEHALSEPGPHLIGTVLLPHGS